MIYENGYIVKFYWFRRLRTLYFVMNHPPLTTSTGRRATGAVGFATRTKLLLASVFILGLVVLEKQSRQITAHPKRFRERAAIMKKLDKCGYVTMLSLVSKLQPAFAPGV